MDDSSGSVVDDMVFLYVVWVEEVKPIYLADITLIFPSYVT